MLLDHFIVDSPNVKYTEDLISSSYVYQKNEIERSADGKWALKPTSINYEFKTHRRVPKLG